MIHWLPNLLERLSNQPTRSIHHLLYHLIRCLQKIPDYLIPKTLQLNIFFFLCVCLIYQFSFYFFASYSLPFLSLGEVAARGSLNATKYKRYIFFRVFSLNESANASCLRTYMHKMYTHIQTCKMPADTDGNELCCPSSLSTSSKLSS